jgi:hypothetical protein
MVLKPRKEASFHPCQLLTYKAVVCLALFFLLQNCTRTDGIYQQLTTGNSNYMWAQHSYVLIVEHLTLLPATAANRM